MNWSNTKAEVNKNVTVFGKQVILNLQIQVIHLKNNFV